MSAAAYTADRARVLRQLARQGRRCYRCGEPVCPVHGWAILHPTRLAVVCAVCYADAPGTIAVLTDLAEAAT